MVIIESSSRDAFLLPDTMTHRGTLSRVMIGCVGRTARHCGGSREMRLKGGMAANAKACRERGEYPRGKRYDRPEPQQISSSLISSSRWLSLPRCWLLQPPVAFDISLPALTISLRSTTLPPSCLRDPVINNAPTIPSSSTTSWTHVARILLIARRIEHLHRPASTSVTRAASGADLKSGGAHASLAKSGAALPSTASRPRARHPELLGGGPRGGATTSDDGTSGAYSPAAERQEEGEGLRVAQQ